MAIGLVLGAIGSFALGAMARATWDSWRKGTTVTAAAGAPLAPADAGAAGAAGKPDAKAAAATPAAQERTEHAVWKLVDNRHAAHRFVDGELVIDASGVGLARYARFGIPVQRWHFGHTVGGERAAIPDRLGPLEIPLG